MFRRKFGPRGSVSAMALRRPPSPLPVETLSPALRALDRLVSSHGTSSYTSWLVEREAAAALQTAAHLLCEEAREVDPHRAERLVLALHQVWPGLPAVERLPSAEARSRLLAVVVSACIRRFYASDGEPVFAPDAGRMGAAARDGIGPR